MADWTAALAHTSGRTNHLEGQSPAQGWDNPNDICRNNRILDCI